MKTIITTTVAAVVLLCGIVSPAFAQNKEHLQMAAELRMLQEQQQQLSLALQQLAEAIKSVNTRIDESNQSTRKGFADQKVAIDGMTSDMKAIRDRVDDTNVRLGKLRDDLDALSMSVTALATQAQPQTAPGVAPAPGDTTSAAGGAPPLATPPPSSTLGLSPTRMYETAWADYTAGQWTLAISGFEAFLRTFPRSEMADDAQFYIGEAQYAQNKFTDAVNAYNAVIQSYPMGDQVPMAYFKRGSAQERLGMLDAARASWNAVVTQFPDSDGGRLAKQRLDQVARQQPPAPAQR